MKKVLNIIEKGGLTVILFFAGMAGALAQESGSVYDMPGLDHKSLARHTNYPAIIFGVLIVVAVYLIYHYWANGRLRDDMS